MFKNYLKIAIRNLSKQKIFTLINIFGLTIGITSAILILLWIRYELNYDHFHAKLQQIYRVVTHYGDSKVPTSPGPMAATLKSTIPEVIDATRFKGDRVVLQYGEKSVRLRGLNAEPGFFDIFTFPVIKGEPKVALDDPSSIVLTETSASRLFGDEDPIGKVVKMNNKWDLKIGGIIADAPENSSPPLQFEYLFPFKVYYFWRDPDDWMKNSDYQTWVMLNPESDYTIVNQKIEKIFRPHLPDSKLSYVLQPFKEIHLQPNTTRWDGPHGDIKYVIIFSVLALLMIFIACLNYMSLSTARSISRSKEIGIRKVVGATRTQLINQHYFESFLLVWISFAIAMIMVKLSLPMFNSIAGTKFMLPFAEPKFMAILFGLFLSVGFLAGTYPSLILSSIKINQNLTNSIFSSQRGKGYSFRKYLVIFQFTVTILVAISTIAIYQQLSFIRNKKLGYNPENLVYFNIGDNCPEESYNSLKNELLGIPTIASVGSSYQIPTELDFYSNVNWRQNEQDMSQAMAIFEVDENFLPTYGMEIISGKNFHKAKDDWSDCSFIINEKAAEIMKFDNSIGQPIKAYEWTGKIVGVVKNFHFENLHEEIKPMIFVYHPVNLLVTARIVRENMPETLKKIEQITKKHYPENPFEYHFFDQELEGLYRKEIKTSEIFTSFTIITILISLLGLYGMISYVTEQKTKEIGIRKVHGADVFSILLLLNKDYLIGVAIAFMIACPIAFLAIDAWLQNFAYRTEIRWLVFALVGLSVLIIALLTVSRQAVKAAMANPVEALKYE
ncbi:MAG: ABC transporter permease [Candidatus Marinimicrobia bacterium]|nr:ABC transporter permease [Candidatus Neomarinimicrobiota bacterium]